MPDLDPQFLTSPLVLAAILGLLLVGGGLASLAVAVVGARHPDPPAARSEATWGQLLTGLALYLGLTVVAAVMLDTGGTQQWQEGGTTITATPDAPSVVGLLAATALAQLAFAVPVLLAAARTARRKASSPDAELLGRQGPRGLAQFGLGARARWSGLLTGLMITLLVAPLLMGVNSLWGAGWVFVTGDLPQQDVAELIRGATGADLLPVFVLAGLAIPLVEELFFRGVLLGFLEVRLGTRQALLISSAVFAALHGLFASGPIFALALVMGLAMVRTRNLLVPFAIHALNNSVQVILLALSTPS
jgi:membrane protease YdiL (CAAX protease family)